MPYKCYVIKLKCPVVAIEHLHGVRDLLILGGTKTSLRRATACVSPSQESVFTALLTTDDRNQFTWQFVMDRFIMGLHSNSHIHADRNHLSHRCYAGSATSPRSSVTCASTSDCIPRSKTKTVFRLFAKIPTTSTHGKPSSKHAECLPEKAQKS